MQLNLPSGNTVQPPLRPRFPECSDEQVQSASIEELLEWLRIYGDRLPRRVVEECARRGDPMAGQLSEIVVNAGDPDDYDTEEEWLGPCNAAYILGLMDSELAAEVLFKAFFHAVRGRCTTSLDNIEWLEWPALFRNKPESVLASLRFILCGNHELPAYARAATLPILLEHAVRAGTERLEILLDQIAELAADAADDLEFRRLAADTLLDFPRERHRELIRQLAGPVDGFPLYTKQDVQDIYAKGVDVHAWQGCPDPWEYYSPEAVEERQRSCEAYARRPPQLDSFDPVTTKVRESPKVGRNDPCPCGSGKKYKKCCLTADD